MADEIHLQTPVSRNDVIDLRVGDVVYLSGVVFTARDMAHARLAEHEREGNELVEDFAGSAIFHAGPVAKRDDHGWAISVVGPTTSMRMEPYSEMVLGRLGARVLIGKGGMLEGTSKALRTHGGVYLLSPPGCAVVQAQALRRVLRVHWLDLGMPEAIWVLDAQKWGPLVVAMDAHGNSVFRSVKERGAARIEQALADAREEST